MDGARVLIECSNNFANEWLPELEWFWYVPRALRNGCYVLLVNSARKRDLPGHGHSAVIAPDGRSWRRWAARVDELLVSTSTRRWPRGPRRGSGARIRCSGSSGSSARAC